MAVPCEERLLPSDWQALRQHAVENRPITEEGSLFDRFSLDGISYASHLCWWLRWNLRPCLGAADWACSRTVSFTILGLLVCASVQASCFSVGRAPLAHTS